MTHFQPLATQRAIRDDARLTSTQKHLLIMATLRATNTGREAGRVKASLRMLAEDAGLRAPKTAERAFKADQSSVLSYFERVDRHTRRLDLWFHLTPDTESAVIPDTESAVDDDSGLCVHDSGHRVRPPASSPAKGKQAARTRTPTSTTTDLAEHLAESQGWPLDHCRQALDAKRAELAARPDVRNAGALLRRIVTTAPDELQAPPDPKHAAAQQERVARESAAEAELGPKPTGHGLEELTYAWGVAANAYQRREQAPDLWRDARAHFLDVQTRYEGRSQRRARQAATA